MLVDSRLAHAYPLTGAMALRARWGSGPGSTFVLAVGGLHPRFAPPADLPKLARIAIAFSSGTNPRLTCEAYFAITANTVQFGARAQLYAAAYGFSIEGDVGYDVLLEIAPLHFIADFHAAPPAVPRRDPRVDARPHRLTRSCRPPHFSVLPSRWRAPMHRSCLR